MFAEVILEIPIDKSFDYNIPESMLSKISPGMRAWVPFGNRRMPGYIVRVKKTSEFPDAKPLIKLIDNISLLSPNLLNLADWIAQYYCCELGKVFKSMLPSRVRQITPKKDEYNYVRIISPCSDVSVLEKRAPKQAQVMRILSLQATAIKLMDLARMASTTPQIIHALQKKGFLSIFSGRIDRDPYRTEAFQQTFPHAPNEEQAQALNTLKEVKNGVILLQGVTGSGKTEVYLQAINEAMGKGNGAIVIVPEISLTPQTVERFKSRFGGENVAVLHSRLSMGERYDQWVKIYDGKARIVIGARSAIFAPVKKLGLIVVDEEHEKSYKQEDDPRYHARDVAVKRGEIENVPVILGSATPSLESYYETQKGAYKLIKLTKRIDDRPLALVKVVNLKEEIKKFQRLLTFSPILLNKIKDRLLKKEQIMLFLNRRGFCSYIMCKHCGHVMRCHHCTTALTYHQMGDKLICHSCGYAEIPPKICPECKDIHIRFSGIGTQRVEAQIARFFPAARIRRMDTDVTTLKGSHKSILDAFKKREIDILVGTQMIAKGLDFPNVTLVGVISADVALHLPDFRAGEHTFQILTQVAGRAGRGTVPGEVVIQTMTPDHPAIRLASTQDYDKFAECEMAIRKELDYPPYEHFVNITFRSRNPKKAELVAWNYQKMFASISDSIKVFGPIPAPISMLRGHYRWQVLLRAKSIEEMAHYFRKLDRHEGVIITYDVDPISML